MSPAEDLDHDAVTRTQLVMARRFVGQCCVLDPQVVSPMRVLWHGFRAWAKPLGHPPSAVALRALLDGAPWCRVDERPGSGRMSVWVHGVGLVASGRSPLG